MQLIDDWKGKILRLHSMRVAIFGVAFWSALSAVWLMWPAFVDWLPLWVYAVGGVAMSIALGLARLLKQPGADA
jgi:hypothetical protein